MTVADDSTDEARCAGCGQAVTRRWLICAHWCEPCQRVRHLVDRIVRWSYDQDGHSTAAEPLQALTDLYLGRATINRLIRYVVRDARAAGDSWEDIGQRLHLDARDARARFERPGS